MSPMACGPWGWIMIVRWHEVIVLEARVQHCRVAEHGCRELVQGKQHVVHDGIPRALGERQIMRVAHACMVRLSTLLVVDRGSVVEEGLMLRRTGDLRAAGLLGPRRRRGGGRRRVVARIAGTAQVCHCACGFCLALSGRGSRVSEPHWGALAFSVPARPGNKQLQVRRSVPAQLGRRVCCS
jgi:hypothetical protein